MLESVKRFFSNHGIPPQKRVIGPVVSAVVSFFLPGAAQAINGQIAKGTCMLLGWFLMYNAAMINHVLYNIVKILQYIIMVISSSDAYFIASRMRLGEEVRTWSVLFLDIHAPTGAAGQAARQIAGQRTLITGVTVVDGTGTAPFRSDVLLEGGIIRFIRPTIPVKEKEYTVVDGTGRILLPGLINPCCCREAEIFGRQEDHQAVSQGITTEISGQNGQSLTPIQDSEQEEAMRRYSVVHGRPEKKISFDNIGMYLMELERQNSQTRMESFVGYGTLRDTVVNRQTERPSQEELSRLCSRTRSGLRSGAKGISFGLAYSPCSLMQDEELEAIFKTIAQCGGRAAVQLPPGGEELLPSLKRIGRLAQKTGAPLSVTNLHAVGAGRELGEEVCRLWDALRTQGADLSLAVTGLPVQPIGLAALLETNCRLEMFRGTEGLILVLPEGETTLDQEAAKCGLLPEELVRRFLEEGYPTHALLKTDDEEFMARLLEESYTSICSDGLSLREKDGGVVTWLLGHYVLDRGLLPLEEAVHRSTMAQAARMGLWDRGLIREGMTADLIMIRPDLLPHRLEDDPARGISKVWIEGALQYDTEASVAPGNTPKTRMFGIRMP